MVIPVYGFDQKVDHALVQASLNGHDLLSEKVDPAAYPSDNAAG